MATIKNVGNADNLCFTKLSSPTVSYNFFLDCTVFVKKKRQAVMKTSIKR